MWNAVKQVWTKSIRRQLVLGIALVHAVLMTIFVFDLVERQQRFLHKQTIEQTFSLAKTLATNSTSWVLSRDLAGLQEVIDSVSQYGGLEYAMIMTPQGEVLGHTDKHNVGLFATDNTSKQLLDLSAQTVLLANSPDLIDTAEPIVANDRVIGWARIALNQQANAASLQALSRDGILYTAGAIMIGILFALGMSRGLTGGLNKLLTVTASVRRGERALRADVQRSDELGQLATDFNRMLDALEENESTLKKTRNELAESEERFNLAMQGANDGLWDYDEETATMYYSSRWKAMLGYAEEEIGNSEDEWSSRVHPDDLAAAQQAIQEHLEGKTPFYQNIHRIRHKDGSWRWHLERGIAVNKAGSPFHRMVGTNTDITQRKLAEERLFEEKERALITLNSIGDAVITTDDKGKVTFLNPVAESLTGWSTDEAKDQPLDNIFHIINEETRQPVPNPVSFCLSNNKIIGLANHTVLINRLGEEISIEDSAAPIHDRKGNIIGVIMVFHDVSEAREMAQQMTWQATHDSLTDLINRREFERRLQEILNTAKHKHSEHALLYMDLDQFKIVNDTCGHVAGDELLKQLSFILQEHLRESDTLARLGGDEFGLLLAGCPMDKANKIARTLLQTVKEFRFFWDDKTFDIGASIGLVKIDEDCDDSHSLLSAADVACYAAKDLGRNRIHIFEPEDEDLMRRRSEMQWVSRINQALENDEFTLYCQRIRPSHDGQPDEGHYEVLLRLNDQDNDTQWAPNAFIPAAERFNLMPAIDRWVIENTFRCIHYNLASGKRPMQTIAINLSGNSFSDDSFLGYVRDQLRNFNIPPQIICFEITETAAIVNLSKANHFIRELRSDGCKFALDDFGSGLSSFSYLKNLPVDFLKIDGSFVRDLVEDPIDHAMVRSINEVGHIMGIKTVAEFVENDTILAELRQIGVDYVQGYGIASPRPMLEELAEAMQP